MDCHLIGDMASNYLNHCSDDDSVQEFNISIANGDTAVLL